MAAPTPASAVAMRAASALLITNQALRELGRAAAARAARDGRPARAARGSAARADLDLSLRTVPARLASFLCTLVAQRNARGEDPRTLVRDLTTETVAGRLGTVREEISRGLALLEREGAVQA